MTKALNSAVDFIIKKSRPVIDKVLGFGRRDKKERPENSAEKERMVKDGLKALHVEEDRVDKDKDNKLTYEEAQGVADRTKKKFPVFSTLKAIDGGARWNYEYIARAVHKEGKGVIKTPVPAGPNDLLVRRGRSWESKNRLQNQADAALAAGFPHGVSVTSPESNKKLSMNPEDSVNAMRKEFENAGFPVHYTPTRRDKYHHTVELPMEVTTDTVKKFNEVLSRSKR